MKILISGSHGLIGQAVFRALAAEGVECVRLVWAAGSPGPDDIPWDPRVGALDAGRLEGFDAVIHLAGENLGVGLWSARKKERIRRSRIRGTRLVADALARCERPPAILICASAMGIYGNRGDEILREESPSGSGFLATLCREWEAACAPAAEAGIRVVNLRFGLVLARSGGPLALIRKPFHLGLGGPIGSGNQYMSWLTLDETVSIIRHVLATPSLSGPVNAATPHPVTNREFTAVLARLLRRPAALRVPAFGLRMLLGSIADETLLCSARLEPAKLLQSGYRFQHPNLESALRELLK